MTDTQGSPDPMSVAELRENLSAALNEVAVQGRIIYVTLRGRPYAAVVPWAVAEAEERRRATGNSDR